MSKDNSVTPDRLTIVGLDTGDGEEHPLFDTRIHLPVDENLVRNIMVYGVLLPVLVRREAGALLVVDGRQRVRAAREASRRLRESGFVAVSVPIKEQRGADGFVAGVMVSANEIRRNDEALDKAAKAVRLLALTNDIDAVCQAFGRSETTIRNWLSVMEADPVVHTAIRAGELTMTAAVELARFPRAEQGAELEKLLRGRGTVAEVKASLVESGLSQASDPNSGQCGSAEAEAEAEEDDVFPAVPAAPASTPSPTPPSRPKPARKGQTGIKRVWLRKALKTETADSLTDEQRAILNWFVTGQSEAGTWYDDFFWDAEAELKEV